MTILVLIFDFIIYFLLFLREIKLKCRLTPTWHISSIMQAHELSTSTSHRSPCVTSPTSSKPMSFPYHVGPRASNIINKSHALSYMRQHLESPHDHENPWAIFPLRDRCTLWIICLKASIDIVHLNHRFWHLKCVFFQTGHVIYSRTHKLNVPP